PPIRTVALVDDTPITAAMLEQAAALRLYRLRKEIYLERRRHLDIAVENRLLSREAKRRGIPTEELLARITRDTKVGHKELNTFLESERAAGRPVSDPDRARGYLAFRKA